MAAWITEIIVAWGPLGVAFLMFLENLFPPIPSEVILPLAGAEAARQGLSVPVMIAAATAGALAGVTAWFWVARAVGKLRVLSLTRRFGRILTLTPADVERADGWFTRHGHLAVLFGRLIPTVRTLISVPAGLSRLSLGRFLIYSAIGTFAWSALLILAGVWLGQQSGAVERWINPVADGVLLLAIAVYVWRLLTFRR